MWSQTSPIRSCVVHMKVRMPMSRASSSTSMIAAVSLNFMSCWRAFSSDMWFTPKNWLSPKRMRSMLAMVERPQAFALPPAWRMRSTTRSVS